MAEQDGRPMKAVYFESHGGNEVLRIGERPDPPAGPGNAVVRIRAAALNHLDIFVRDGLPNVPIALPHIPGRMERASSSRSVRASNLSGSATGS